MSKYGLMISNVKKAFFEEVKEGNLAKVAKEWGVSRSTAYRWKLELEILKELETRMNSVDLEERDKNFKKGIKNFRKEYEGWKKSNWSTQKTYTSYLEVELFHARESAEEYRGHFEKIEKDLKKIIGVKE